jgi:glycine/D-amino acid oxidase-like deaminating enzyme
LVFRATCFVDPYEANALLYLGALFPLIIPTWAADFTHTYDKLTRGCRDQVLCDRVQGLDRRSDGTWEVRTATGRTYRARNVVLAVPAHNLASLYPPACRGRAVPATVLYVRGQRRPLLHKRFLLLPADPTGVALVWRRRGGRDQVISLRPQPDLQAVFQSHEVIESVTWKTAVVLADGDWVPMLLEPGLYLAGDHNLPGLEASFLTGMCAARHILCGPHQV